MRALALFAPALLAATPAPAQDSAHHHAMGQMAMPGEEAPPATAPAPAPADDQPGEDAPPPIATDHAADRYHAPGRMAAARAALLREGQWTGGALILDRLDYQAGSGPDGLAWKAQAWRGGDSDRLVIATEGEARAGHGVERAEIAALWRHALDPWFNLEAGVRQDVRPGPRRTYAVIGVEGLAPWWIETEARLFVSQTGDVHARLGASHDLRLSGPLVLRGEAEVNLAFQAVPALGIGAGFERTELGARLRYELRPELAPYVGIDWERRLGATARATRAAGEPASRVSAVMGLSAFF
ncbi:copper resistance protein B [Novosphingobium bradum]|uniref:Copper resistance protein B n=1 Tax=Novosphingobium bradum TaxID=1737444 RepID=A0ABV7ITX2_9SPHN